MHPDDIEKWNGLNDSQKKTLFKYGRYKYLADWFNFYDVPIDIAWIFEEEGVMDEYECFITERLRELTKKYGVIFNNKNYTYEQVNDLRCFLNTKKLLFCINPEKCTSECFHCQPHPILS